MIVANMTEFEKGVWIRNRMEEADNFDDYMEWRNLLEKHKNHIFRLESVICELPDVDDEEDNHDWS